jgi:RNA polymerase sigma factor (sigma-70 family)
VSSGTDSSVEKIFEQIRVRLVEYVSSRGMQGRAEDIAQEALVILWKRYSHLTTEGDLVPLAYRICKYKILEERRAQNKAGYQLNEELPIADPSVGVHDKLEDSEFDERLKEALKRLSERCKTLFRLRLEERPTAEIAKLMGVPEGTIYVCRKGLFEKLAGNGA